MRILTVSAFFESHGGGVEIVADSLARALARRGHDSRITGAAFDPAPTGSVVTPVPLSVWDPLELRLGLPMPIPIRTSRKLLTQEVEAADAVIVHDSLYVSSIWAAREAKRLGKPWILIQHIGEMPYSNLLLKSAFAAANALVTRRMLSTASQTLFISDVVRRYFAGVRTRNPPELMFNGVDKSLFKPRQPGEEVNTAEFNLTTSGRIQLLFVGRFVERKGLAALRDFAVLRPDCDLVLVGSGPIDPAQWNLPNVHLLGRRSRAELARLYRACHALILPSIGEGYPLVVQEALASGLPVYCGLDSASADPGAAEFLHGFDVDPDNPGKTAARLSAAISTIPPKPDSKAAAYAAERYDWDANATKLENMIEQLRKTK